MNKLILITGATGNQGGAVIRHLVGKGFSLRALTRNPESDAAKAIAKLGVDVVKGDLDDGASLEAALEGVWGVFSVQNTWEAGVEKEEIQGKRLAELAHKKGVSHFVYSSVGSAHRQTGIPHFDNKARVEDTVRGLKFASYVIVRPVFFMENLTSPWFMNGDVLGTAMKPETLLQMVSVDDIGKIGARAFTHAEELNGQAIDLAGDIVTMPTAAEILSRGLDKKFSFVQYPIEEIRKNSEDFAVMLEWFDRVGYNADIPSLEAKFGPLMKLEQWVRQPVAK